MRLLYELEEDNLRALRLEAGEALWYCIPVDLAYSNKEKLSRASYGENSWIVVTDKRICVLLDKQLDYEQELDSCERVKCEHQVNCGILTVTDKNGQSECIARFSMKHIVRVSYVARGAQAIIKNLKTGIALDINKKIKSDEYEKYCEKCGKAMPGTSTCPSCEGSFLVFKKLMALCGQFVGKLLLISLLMVIITGVNIVTPIVQRGFIDKALVGNGVSAALLWQFIIVTFILLLLRIGFETLRVWNCAKLGATMSMSLREKLYYKIQALSLSFINNRKPGELMNRVSGDTRSIRRFMEEVFGDMFSTILTMIVSLVMMIIISWKMTLLSMVFIVVVFVVTKIFWHRIHTIFHRQWLKEDEVRSSLQDVISGMRIVKAFGKEERESGRFRKKTEEFAKLSSRNETFWAIFFPCLTFLMGVGTYIAIYFGGIEVLGGDMSVGELVQFITYSGFLYGPLGWMTHLPRAMMEMITSLNRIYDVLDEKPTLADAKDSIALDIKGVFEFKEVSFGYQTYEPVLENISFSVKEGEMIGLVGASGTGKSTMINLIMRLYDPDQGNIYVDGVDLKDVKLESLHSQIGVVLQETFLFSGTILDNIRFAKRDAALEEVIRAAKAANAHDFICKTPDGYNTYVGEHGYNLSGGERQRIAIARAILNNPRILILDEATSALDTESEYLIQQALDRLVKGRTTFAIAHRLSTLRNADRLIVIDKHGIAEMGTHNELLDKKGIYYGLVKAQLKMSQGEDNK